MAYLCLFSIYPPNGNLSKCWLSVKQLLTGFFIIEAFYIVIIRTNCGKGVYEDVVTFKM